jgi:hypothetical protein
MTAPSGIITLLSDFGTRDPFVGVMKGVLLQHFPAARLVDLCHEIEPQRVVQAAYWIERSFGWFPSGTVHVVVVDPGVGSERSALVVRAGSHHFVAPDNGVLSGVLRAQPFAEVRRIELERHGLRPPSATFHGRDVFAPIAAELARGRLAFEGVGPSASAERLELAEPRSEPGGVTGQVVVVDRFGNLITNLGRQHARDAIEAAGTTIPLRRTYSDVPSGSYVALINAFDSLEIARRDGSAAAGLGLSAGALVRIPS